MSREVGKNLELNVLLLDVKTYVDRYIHDKY